MIDLLDNRQYGDYKFLLLSPERLQSDWIIDRIKKLPINLITIDEAQLYPNGDMILDLHT
jgi:ATP-dependent DNA helicase RecQ